MNEKITGKNVFNKPHDPITMKQMQIKIISENRPSKASLVKM